MLYQTPASFDDTARAERITAMAAVTNPQACSSLHELLATAIANSPTTGEEDVHVLCRLLAHIIATQVRPAVQSQAADDLPCFLSVIIDEVIASNRAHAA
ncbi:MAG: hypothetical protein POG24_09070 [Acidocella sp.]|nr:hypothetical protein [Acidocella sp.]